MTDRPTRLRFKPGNHAYELLIDPDRGRWERLPSVTTLLSQIDKPALKQWASRTAAEYAVDHWDQLAALSPAERRKQIAGAPWQSRDKAAAKGTAIHSMAEDLIAGRPVDVPDELASKVQGLARWIEASRIRVVRSEAMVWTEPDPEFGSCGYAGTFDAIVEHPRHGLTLIDWKTGTGVYPEFGVQLAGYASAEWIVTNGLDVPMPHFDRLAVAHVRPDGTDLHLLDQEQRQAAEDRFHLLRSLRLADLPAFAMEAVA